MTPRELYEKYKGRRAKDKYGNYGIVVGYSSVYWLLIISITEKNGLSWNRLYSNDHIKITNINYLGYSYVGIKDIIPFKFGW